MSDTILDVQGLRKHFEVASSFFDALVGKQGQVLIAVDGVSFTVERHETLGLVGESGCGKSTLARCILRLYEPSEGTIIFNGRDITGSLLSSCFGPERVFVLNEIAAHAEGALHYDARVDTIFEIGGQDAKYIRLADGRVVDAAMNEACSAGTGSFIEEQGKKFSAAAAPSASPKSRARPHAGTCRARARTRRPPRGVGKSANCCSSRRFCRGRPRSSARSSRCFRQ